MAKSLYGSKNIKHADYRQNGILNSHSAPNNTIDVFAGSANFGSLSFGHGSTQLGNEAWNGFSRGAKRHDYDEGFGDYAPITDDGTGVDTTASTTIADPQAPMSNIMSSMTDAASQAVSESVQAVTDNVAEALPADIHLTLADAAKQLANQILQDQNASVAEIALAYQMIDALITPEVATKLVAEAVVAPLAAAAGVATPASFQHPLFNFSMSFGQADFGSNQLGDWFTTLIRDPLEKVVANTATTAIAPLISNVVQTVVGGIATSPGVQAATSTVAQSGFAAVSAMIKQYTTAAWANYKWPVMIGATGILGLIAYKMLKKKV